MLTRREIIRLTYKRFFPIVNAYKMKHLVDFAERIFSCVCYMLPL